MPIRSQHFGGPIEVAFADAAEVDLQASSEVFDGSPVTIERDEADASASHRLRSVPSASAAAFALWPQALINAPVAISKAPGFDE